MTSSLLSMCHGTISQVFGNGFYFGIHTYMIVVQQRVPFTALGLFENE